MTIFLRGDRGRYERVRIEDLRCLIADSNYTTVVTKEREFVVSKTLGTIFEEFKKMDVCNKLTRISRGVVVNLDAVKQIEGNILYIDGKQVVVSKSMRHVIEGNFVLI